MDILSYIFLILSFFIILSVFRIITILLIIRVIMKIKEKVLNDINKKMKGVKE